MADNRQSTSQQPNMDGPSEAEFTDAQVAELYNNGLISRAEADVFNVIANFNEGQGDILCRA